MRDGQTNDKRTSEDRATQPNGSWKLSFAKSLVEYHITNDTIEKY